MDARIEADERPQRDLTRGAVWKGLVALGVLLMVAVVSFLPKLAPGL